MRKLNLSILFVSVIALFVSGCAKDPIAGPAGVNGTNGTNGTNGNANIKSISKTITWSPNSNYYNSYVYLTEINQDILDKGMVQVYATGNGYQDQLPITTTYAGYFNTIDFSIFNGYIVINSSNSDQALRSTPSTTTFKIVVSSGN